MYPKEENMNWKAAGKVLFFVGLGIFAFTQIQSAVFSSYYGVWTTDEMRMEIGYKIFDWFHNLAFELRNTPGGWPGLMVLGAALWVGGRNPDHD